MGERGGTIGRLSAELSSRYRIDRELGTGGMATVYLAEDLRHGREVAIKVLHPELSAVLGPDRFLAEIKLTAALQHPHILPLFDSGSAEGLLYYVMPYVEGETLRARLTRERQLPVGDATRIASEVADALEYAHRHRVIHRDVKPENILLRDGHALVADFGIALAVQQAGGERMTQTGMSLGTPQYMAPEQAMGEKNVDHRADIYALGAVTYEMLAGEAPFTGPSSQAIVAKVMTEEPKRLGIQRRSVPEALESAVHTALEKLPADRFASAAEFAQALAAPGVRQRQSGSVRRRPARRGAMYAAAAGVLLGAAGFWLGSMTGARRAQEPGFGSAAAVTWDAGLEVHPAISPDGRFVAYAAGLSATRLRIYVRPVAGGRAVRLTDDTTDAQSEPRWLPDGTRILFLARGGVFSAPATGGPARQEVREGRGTPINSAAWSPDGTRIAYVVGDTLILQERGGTPQPVATMPEPTQCSWSPDASRVACGSGNAQYSLANQQFGNLSPSRIAVVRIADGSVGYATDNASANQSPVWADNQRLIFVSNRHGPRDLYSVDIGPGRTTPVPAVRLTTGLNAHSISLPSDGSRLAYSAFTTTANVWSVHVPQGEALTTDAAEPVTQGNQLIETLQVSDDRRWLYYDSNVSGNSDVYRIPVRGGEPERLTTDPSDDFSADGSPDGREIAFHSWRSGNREVYVMPLDGGPVQQVTRSALQEVLGGWSPDGSALLFFEFNAANDSVGRGGLWIARRSADGAWRTPQRRLFPGYFPAWSPDGRHIAYADAPLAVSLHVAPADSGPSRLVYRATRTDDPRVEQVVWSDDGRDLYFKSHDAAGVASIWSVPAAGGRPRLLMRFDDPSRPSSRFNMAAGGGRLFFTIDERRSDVWVMEVSGERRNGGTAERR